MTDLTGLIERVRAATGLDTELEVAIVAHFWNANEARIHKHSYLAMHAYATSADAAIALAERVLPGSAVGLDPVFFEGDGHPRIEYDAIVCIPRWERWNPINSNWIERHEARHKDRVLAITLATLLALQATGAE